MIRVVAGGLAAVLVAAHLAVVEVFWLPLRIGGVPVPVSIAAAVVGNLLLVSATHRFTRSRAAAALPAAVWLVVVLAASLRRPEGDLLVTGSLPDLGFLLLGAMAGAVAVGRVLAAPRPRARQAGGRG